MSTVLVIGAGSALARAALPVFTKDNTIITAGRKDCDVYCDINKSVEIPSGVDVVVNFAANFGGTSDEAITAAVETNVLGTLRICEAVKKAQLKQLVLVSSIFAALDESSPSYSIYALTKKHADELAVFYCKLHEIPLTILRPSRIYGDDDSFAKNQPFLYQIVDKAQRGEDIVLYGKHDARRNYIHSADLAEIINRVISRQVAGVFACTAPEDATYSHIAKSAQHSFGRGSTVTFAHDKPDIPDDVFPADYSLYDKIDYRPSVSIDDGLRRIKEYREKGTA
ncbi:MAG TPA: NAD(P)-dependent oxidoreductase [Candidatus Saccharimonadales bacterium]|nr:NAD(P)-dependent oxidoreductase [Candidatus Saccharimonadales bacterium]